MNLSPLPIQKFFANNGRPADGYQLFTYIAGTTTKVDTFTSDTGMVLNTNPIILNFRGEANIWLDVDVVYKFVFAPANDTDPPTNPIWTVDNISPSLTVADITQQFIGAILFPRTAAELSAGITPIDYFYEPGRWARYGAAVAASAATNFAAINNSMLSNTQSYEIIAGTYSINDKLSAQSGQTIELPMGVTVKPTSWADTGIEDTGIIDIDGKATVNVIGGILDGNKATLPISRIFGVRVQDSSNVNLAFNQIVNCPGSTSDGVLAGDGWYVAGSSLRFQAFGVVSASNVRNNATLAQCDGAAVIGGFYDGATGTNPGAGIDLESDNILNPIYDAALIGVGMRSNYHALQVSVGSNGVEVMGCALRESDARMLAITSATTVGFIGNHLVSDISNNGDDLCEIANSNNVRLIGNDWHGSANTEERSALYISDNVQTLVISGNIFRSTFSQCIRIGNTGMTTDILDVVIVGNVFVDCVAPGQAAPIIHIVGNAGSSKYPRRITIRDNLFYDSRAGGDRATAAVQIASDIPDAVLADYDIGDNLISGPISRYVNCPNEGSFTGTLTGCTTSPTGSLGYCNDAGNVTLAIPAITATSNTTAATVTGMPVYLRPTSSQVVLMVNQDNGTEKLSRATVGTDGVITLQNALTAVFTNSGTKGSSASTVTYRRV